MTRTSHRRLLTNGTTFTRTVVRDAYRRNLIIAITNSVNGVAIETLEYAYDALGRPVSRNADTFAYNARGEVVTATITGGSPSPATAEYGYDGIGNSTNWIANCLNQYSPFTYDLDGNLLTNGVFSYAYGADNRLSSVSSNGVLLVTNFYDAQGRRVRKIVSHGGTEAQRFDYLYDGWLLVRETATGLSTDYVWGKDLSGTLQGAGGVGGLLYLTVSNSSAGHRQPSTNDYQLTTNDSSLFIPFYDANGNITHYCDAQGNIVASYTYDAFGNTIAKSGPMADNFNHRFSTKYLDAETGLYYYGYRFYSPELMRWINRDPIEEQGGANLYAFCENNAIKNADSYGLAVVVIKNPAGKAPPNGWRWSNSRAETHWEYPSFKVYGLPCGKGKMGYYVWIDPPITLVNVYFRTLDNTVLAMAAEQQHIDIIMRYDSALSRYKHNLESICKCQPEAERIRTQQDAIINQALQDAEKYHNWLDAPGGPHGH